MELANNEYISFPNINVCYTLSLSQRNTILAGTDENDYPTSTALPSTKSCLIKRVDEGLLGSKRKERKESLTSAAAN